MVTDALVLAPCVDGVLVVIKPSITKRTALKNLLEQLAQVNAKVLGIVLNDVKVSHSHYYKYNYHGYYNRRKYDRGYGYLETAPESTEEPEVPADAAAAPVSKFLNITRTPREEKGNLDSSEAKPAAPDGQAPSPKV
jgi:Mrp family chromosome partitioning ATPase